MKVGDRLTLLVDRNDFIVRPRAPYTLGKALEHLEGLEPVIAEGLSVVVVEVIGAAEARDRAQRDTLPAPPPKGSLADALRDFRASAPDAFEDLAEVSLRIGRRL